MKSISIVTALLTQTFVPAPFAVSVNNCTFTDVRLWLDYYMLKPSEVVACNKKVQINSTNFKHYLQDVNDIFANNDGLYYTSIDPMKNLPLNYQEELGYSVYHGETEGQIDLKSELNKIIAKIDQKGFADASQFWEMNKIFQMLKDGHVYLNPGTPLGQLETKLIGSSNFVLLIPKNNYENDWSYKYSSKFSLVDNEIILSIADDIDAVSRKVLSIGDVTPHDLLIKLANISGISNWSKDLGANINAIIKSAFNNNDIAIAIFSLYISPDVFVDDYLIKYDDDEEEMLLARVEVPITELAKYEIYSDMLNRKIMLDVSSIEEDINLPGKLFKAKSFGRFEEVRQCTPNFNRNLETNNENIESRKMDESHNEENTFRLIGWPYYIYDAYTVLQLNTFLIDSSEQLYQSIAEDWNLMVSKSPSKKLIIDVSKNNGGDVTLNQLMTKLLFPTVDTTYLKNYVNAPYNDMMDAYLNVFIPLTNTWQNVTDNQGKEYIKLLDVESLCKLEESYDLFWNLYSEEIKNFGTNYTSYEAFFEPLQSFFDDMSVGTLDNLIAAAFYFVKGTFDPISAQGLNPEYVPTEPELVIRGGKQIKQFTNIDLFASHYEDYVPDYVQQYVDSSPSFDEYILLSDGICVSACDQFVTTSMQVWRNRNISQSKQPVHVVTYGGLGKPIDPSQWGAGFIVSPKVHHNYGPYLALRLLWDATGEIEYFNAAANYEDVMPNIPFYANIWPQMSATEVYSNFMMPTGIPMDYLKKNPDHHIPEMFVPFNHSVYFEVSKYFVTTSDAMSSALKHRNSVSTCMASMAMMVGFSFML